MREVDQTAFVAAHRDGAVVIDVRQPYEYVAGHVPGADLVPLSRLSSSVAELPRGVPVYVICASGNRSLAAADFLARAGIDAWSVAGGTGAWQRAGRPVVHGTRANAVNGESTVARIRPIDTLALGDRSYLVHDGRVAFVVDPQRDIDRVLDLAASEGVRITHVFAGCREIEVRGSE